MKILLLLFLTINLFADKQSFHPQFKIKYFEDKTIDYNKTCGDCHNTEFINSHNTHKNVKNMSCATCHTPTGKLEIPENSIDDFGFIKKEFIKIQTPEIQNCSKCHTVFENDGKLTYPDDFENSLEEYQINKFTGVIVSPQVISKSGLNLKNKSKLNHPFDIHASRELNCSSCHTTLNNPREIYKTSLKHLIKDTRKMSTGEYLEIPDHNLTKSTCTDCHNPNTTHNFLPYKQRHFEKISCQSCHIPQINGIALQTVDKSVVNSNGQNRFEYRNFNKSGNLNTDFIEGYSPYLFANYKLSNSQIKLSPFNFVTHYYWVDSTGKEIPENIIKDIFIKENKYNEDVTGLFDANKNNAVENDELIINSKEKYNFVKTKLENLSYKSVSLKGEIKSYQINHGVTKDQAIKNCNDCHGSESKLRDDIILSSNIPLNDGINFEDKTSMYINGSVKTENNKLILKRDNNLKGVTILGYEKTPYLNTLGFSMALLLFIGVLVHGALRYKNRLLKKHPHKLEKVLIYSIFERIWHWTLAISIVILIFTGFIIHYTESDSFMSLQTASFIHNIFALILIFDTMFGFFLLVTSGQIKQYLPDPKTHIKNTIAHIKYYISGIFKGEPHPVEKTPERRLNPLQQMTYLAVLNFLLPAQIITGGLMWGVSVSVELSNLIGGLDYIIPIHRFIAFLFLTYIILHVYLTTAGHSLLSDIKAMITGYSEVEKTNTENKHE